MLSPAPSAVDIQTHLYSSFLHASTHDVALRVSGSWSAVYKLHRVVLIQSGFFKSLFTAGFSESAVRLVTLRNGTDEISVIFDDHNITRPAFEVCISRLYGGGPLLYVSPNLIPTSNHPLTPPFSNAPVSQDVPAGKHPASPRFLLSLLATAIYLSIPSIASQALSLVLKTIGPTTVVQYLNFARGRPIDIYSQEALKDPHAAVGLEHVAQLVDQDEVIKSTEGVKLDAASVPDPEENSFSAKSSQQKINEAIGVAGSSESSSDGEFDESTHQTPIHHYGAISNKIGEACACWLVRWATDMLKLEIAGSSSLDVNIPDTRTRSKSVSYITNGAVVNQELPPPKVPPIFSRKGLSAQWVASIVSADTLFVKNERERYDFARSIVEMRRNDGLIDYEESIWATMFERGIYYANMTFEDILSISRDISPLTKKPYVSLSTLQAAHWTQSVLRNIITGRPITVGSQNNTGTVSPPPREKELGVTLSTAEILSKISDKTENDRKDDSTVYYPVSPDSSSRIGVVANPTPDTTPGAAMSMDDLFSPSPESPNPHTKTRGDAFNQVDGTEENFFGILTPTYTSQSCISSDPLAKSSWSPYPPYRFSVEFWDVDLLKEKSRLYSQTIWHAGNLFNIYVQMVRKKGQPQLGIYLHRQSNVDPIPPLSVPSFTTPTQPFVDGNITGSFERSGHLRQPSLPSLLSSNSGSPHSNHYSPSIHPPSRSTTPSTSVNNARPSSSLPGSPLQPSLGLGNSPATLSTLAPQQPYRDPRPSVSAYFAVSCASATGSSQTRFSSAPDVFSVSQSWGWKSSTLRTEDFVDVNGENSPNRVVLRNERVSIRATVLLGLV